MKVYLEGDRGNVRWMKYRLYWMWMLLFYAASWSKTEVDSDVFFKVGDGNLATHEGVVCRRVCSTDVHDYAFVGGELHFHVGPS